MVYSLLGYRLGEVDACVLRATLTRLQRLHVELGLWRDAAQITAETADICSEMRREDLVAETMETMLNALPASLPRHVAAAVRQLRRALNAVDRAEVSRAAANLRAALALRPFPAL